MNTTSQIEVAEQAPVAFASQWVSNAGPLQTKRVTEALGAITREGQTHSEISGVIGQKENEYSMWSPFSPARPEAGAALAKIAEDFNYTITRENHGYIIAAAEAAVLEVRKSRPVNDTRRTAAQEAEIDERIRQADAERAAAAQNKAEQASRIAAELRAKYPWARSDDKLSTAARAAANLKSELNRTFPGVNFSVRSDRFSGGNSIDVGWDFGPSTDQVKKISDKYRSGHFDGMTDSYDYDHSAYGEAVDQVLGRSKHINLNRKCEMRAEDQMAEACGLAGEQTM